MASRRLLLFDFDGVIADSYEIYHEMSKLTFEALGMSHLGGEEAYLDLFEENFYDSLTKRGVDLAAFGKASRTIVPRFDGRIIPLFKDVMPVIGELARRHTLIIISSNSRHFITRALEGSGYQSLFADILGSDFMLSKVKKIAHALAMQGIEREHAYFIGDTSGDIREAKKAQVKTIAVTWGWHSKERLLKANPDFLIDTPGELLTFE